MRAPDDAAPAAGAGRRAGAAMRIAAAAANGGGGGAWLRVMRRYVAFSAVAHLAWEVVQLPLYTIWYEAGAGEIAFAVLHCTGGDLLIAGASLVLALLLLGEPAWPVRGQLRVAALAVAFGALYTVFSEWLNTEVRGSWAYADAMPVVPPLGTGLSPLAQWLVIPPAGLWWAARRRALAASPSNNRG